jgi:DNA-binding transcriptional regulator WhiA
MERWINKRGKIIDEDFAYLCGSLVLGLSVYSSKKRRYLSLGNTDNSYVTYVSNVIKKLTSLNPTVGRYSYKSKIKGQEYETPRTNMVVDVPDGEKDFFTTLMTFKKNYQKLNKLILRSNKKMQRRFLQAIMDARASLVVKTKYDLDIYLHANHKQFPIIGSVLDSYGIAYLPSPKKKPKFLYIKEQEDVDKILKKIGFNSECLKLEIKDWVMNLYNSS